MLNQFLKTKFLNPFLEAFKTGSSISQLALCSALGVTLGMCPIIGSSTLLCLGVAYKLKLNIPLIQAINLACTPFAIAACIPLIRFGEFLMGFAEKVDLGSPQVLVQSIAQDPRLALHVVVSGLVGWLFFAIPMSIALFYVLKPVLRLVKRSLAQSVEMKSSNDKKTNDI